MRRAPAILAAVWLALTSLTVARADGEAGVVIDYGTHTESFCVAFAGDSISGDALLAAAGREVNQFSGLVCGIDAVGCLHSGSFDSCTCQCRGSNCTYWAFFTRDYGQGGWTYSGLGFRLARAGDGDLQGWRWGAGTLTSAPPPAGVTFEQVCGHAPRGGASQPPQATATSPPTSMATTPAGTLPTPVATRPAPLLTPAIAPTLETRETPLPGAQTTDNPPTAATTQTITAAYPEGGPQERTAASADDSFMEDDDRGGLVAFALVAAGLLAAIAGAVAWRRSHGS